MIFFKAKKERNAISVEERALSNKLALENLLKVLANTGNANMQKWQDEIKGMKNG